MKSNWISNVQTPCGIGEVVSPREVTYSVTCQEWFVHGVSVRRIFPTICVHMCRVMAVSFHSAKDRDGQSSDAPFISEEIRLAPCRRGEGQSEGLDFSHRAHARNPHPPLSLAKGEATVPA